LLSHWSHDPDLPDVTQRDSRAFRLCRARPEAAPGSVHDRALLTLAPGLLGRRRERLVELVETRCGVSITHVAKQHIVHALKVWCLGGPAAVAPDDLAGKTFGAEQLVAEHLDVVTRLGIDMDDQAAVCSEGVSGRLQARPQG